MQVKMGGRGKWERTDEHKNQFLLSPTPQNPPKQEM